jgi:hypothetical protein
MCPIDPEAVVSLSDNNAIIHKLLEIEHDTDIILQIIALNDYNQCSPAVVRVLNAIRQNAFQIKEGVARCVRLDKLPHTLPAIKEVARDVLGWYGYAVELTRIACGACSPSIVEYFNEAI